MKADQGGTGVVESRPFDKPRTKAEALEMALKWGSEWSHWNEHAAHAHQEDDGSSWRGAFVTAAQHDAAEVQRLAALHSMLPPESKETL